MSEQKFDLIVIGAGPAGYVGAIRAAQLGMKVACVEKRNTLGGTCLNIGCIPSKALLDSSEHYYHTLNKLEKHGILVGHVQLDLNKMIKRKEDVVKQLTGGIAYLFKKNKITSFNGHATLKDVSGSEKSVEVKTATGTEIIQAKNILLATGSTPIELPFLPFDEKKILSSTGALSLDRVPNHLVLIGGGYIGLEMGSVWLRLGAKVTVVEYADRILPAMDEEVTEELYKALKKQGMEFLVETQCMGADTSKDVILVEVQDRKTKESAKLECDQVLVCTGRKPNTEGLGLKEAGVTVNEKGQVVINDHFETSVKGVYAVGDIVRGPMLAHKGEEEGIAAAEIMNGRKGHVNYNAIPGVIFTWPELASVGLSEHEVKEKGIDYKVGKFPFMANGRAKAMEEQEGIVKIIADKKTDRVLGVHICGPRASEMIPEAVSVMEFGGSAEDIALTCHAHPTLSEVMKEAALDVHGRKIHL